MAGIIRVHAAGGQEVLSWESVDVAAPGPGELRVRQTAIGIHYIDVYHRTGRYAQTLPFIPAVEGAGVVEDVGQGVTRFQRGDRVAYAGRSRRSIHSSVGARGLAHHDGVYALGEGAPARAGGGARIAGYDSGYIPRLIAAKGREKTQIRGAAA